MLRRLVQRGVASSSSSPAAAAGCCRALFTLPHSSCSSSPLAALTRRLSRITLLEQPRPQQERQRQRQRPLPPPSLSLSLATHARTTDAAAPPPPPPPPPPPSFSPSLPPNLILADPGAIAAFKPMDIEEAERRVQMMVGAVPPEQLFLPVLPSLTGEKEQREKEKVALDPRVWAVPVRRDIVHRVVVWQRAKRRWGLASTKRVGEIRGSTHKVRQQKGTGRARAGKKHAPQFRGGYKPHGPRERDFAIKLNKKVRALGLRVALSAKAREGRVVVVEHLGLPEAKTKVLAHALMTHHHEWANTTTANGGEGESGRPRRLLFVDGEAVDSKMALACRNLPYAMAMPQLGANVMDVLAAEVLVLSRPALEALTARLLP